MITRRSIHRGLWGALLALSLVACSALAPTRPTAEIVHTLAPSGTLRIGVYPGSPTSILIGKDGQSFGLSHDWGVLVAQELGVSYRIVTFERIAQVLDAMKKGEVDLTFTNASPARRTEFAFTPPLLKQDLTLLVRAGVALSNVQQMDVLFEGKPLLLGVSEGSSSQTTLKSRLKLAQIIVAPNLAHAAVGLRERRIDAFATNRGILLELQSQVPGSSILQDAWGQEQFAIGIPKGREKAIDWLTNTAQSAIRNGTFETMIKRSGLLGAEILKP